MMVFAPLATRVWIVVSMPFTASSSICSAFCASGVMAAGHDVVAADEEEVERLRVGLAALAVEMRLELGRQVVRPVAAGERVGRRRNWCRRSCPTRCSDGSALSPRRPASTSIATGPFVVRFL